MGVLILQTTIVIYFPSSFPLRLSHLLLLLLPGRRLGGLPMFIHLPLATGDWNLRRPGPTVGKSPRSGPGPGLHE